MAFKEAVYLVLTHRGVEKMYKNLPVPGRGQIVVKLVVSAADTAFREPTLVREVVVTDPLDGMQIPDVEFSQPFITEAEAQLLKQRRRDAMIGLLEQQGYTVRPPDPGSDLDHQEEQVADEVYRK